MEMGVKHGWNDIGRDYPKYPEGNLFQCHFVRCLSHMDWIGIEPGPRREAGHYPPEPGYRF